MKDNLAVWAVVAEKPTRIIGTYRNLGAAKGARTQMRRPEWLVVKYKAYEVVA